LEGNHRKNFPSLHSYSAFAPDNYASSEGQFYPKCFHHLILNYIFPIEDIDKFSVSASLDEILGPPLLYAVIQGIRGIPASNYGLVLLCS
jgi:hypothetical protein